MFTQTELDKIASELRQEMDNASLRDLKDARRTHLGASEIGEECLCRLWYGFRWIVEKSFEPRMLRLFDRGKKEEHSYVQHLRNVGFEVREVNPETGKQYLFSDFDGHYGGSSDGLAMHHTRLPDCLLVSEFKTHNSKSFSHLVKNGVKISKPKHFAQMSNYGKRFGAYYGVYLAGNKDDDDLHLEIIQLDWSLADAMTEKAKYIISENRRPPKINGASPAFWHCKMCEGQAVCFQRKPADKNCRSCLHARPAPNAEWGCVRWNGIIPKDVIPKGCPEYRSILEQ